LSVIAISHDGLSGSRWKRAAGALCASLKQIRNRAAVEDWPDLGSPDFGLTYFRLK